MAGWKPLIIVAAVFAALAAAAPARAQQRDPLIDPPSGGQDSRFQIVGQSGWVPGESITLSLAFTTSTRPLEYAGPFPYVQQVTVLRDGTWFFPIVVREDVLGFPLPGPGFIVVRAESATQTAVNAYIYTPDGRFPPGSETLTPAGAGPLPASPALLLTLGLFALGTGVLLVASGTLRRDAN